MDVDGNHLIDFGSGPALTTVGNVFGFLPPLVTPDPLLEEGLDLIEAAFDAVLG